MITIIYYDNREFDTQLKYEVYVLRKFLAKHYGDDKAVLLIKKYSKDIIVIFSGTTTDGKSLDEFFNLYKIKK